MFVVHYNSAMAIPEILVTERGLEKTRARFCDVVEEFVTIFPKRYTGHVLPPDRADFDLKPLFQNSDTVVYHGREELVNIERKHLTLPLHQSDFDQVDDRYKRILQQNGVHGDTCSLRISCRHESFQFNLPRLKVRQSDFVKFALVDNSSRKAILVNSEGSGFGVKVIDGDSESALFQGDLSSEMYFLNESAIFTTDLARILLQLKEAEAIRRLSQRVVK